MIVKTLSSFHLQNKSQNSVRLEKNTDQKKTRIWTIFTQCYWPSVIWTSNLWYEFKTWDSDSLNIKQHNRWSHQINHASDITFTSQQPFFQFINYFSFSSLTFKMQVQYNANPSTSLNFKKCLEIETFVEAWLKEMVPKRLKISLFIDILRLYKRFIIQT